MQARMKEEMTAHVTKVLSAIIAGDLSNITKRAGICYNIVQCGSDIDIACLKDSFKSWKHYSGHIEFPVPTPEDTKYTHVGFRYFDAVKWEGDQLRLRQDLAQHLLRDIDAIIERAIVGNA